MTQWMLHSISSTASAGIGTSILLTIPLSLSFFLLLCLSSSHHHHHHHLLSPLSIPPLPPPPSLVFPARPQTDEEGKSGSGSSSGSSRRTGRCAEACTPHLPPPSCSTGKALCSPLISVKVYLFVMRARLCALGYVCACEEVLGQDLRVGYEDYRTSVGFTAAGAAVLITVVLARMYGEQDVRFSPFKSTVLLLLPFTPISRD